MGRARQRARSTGVFLSTYEKQLDAKRRFVVPQDYRTADTGSQNGVFCFPSIEADCIEAGGDILFDQYQRVVDDLPFGDPLRTALEDQVFGQQRQLAYDTAGRITLPESLCAEFGLSDVVVVVGLRERFQIWEPAAYRAWRGEQKRIAREGLAQLGELKRAAGLRGPA